MFDRSQLQLKPLSERKHDLDISIIKEPSHLNIDYYREECALIARRIIGAKKTNAAVIMMMGGHVFRSGVQKYIIDLIERGLITHLATNGSGMIHDYEYSLIGATTENVANYIAQGQFGLWQETGKINDLINLAFAQNNSSGMGGTIGKAIAEGNFPHKNISLFAASFKNKTPITVHVGIGQDIIHEHPNCNGAATGALSYNDFLCFTESVQKLEGGVILNFGSAVMAPEIFLKALSMARNVAKHQKNKIEHFLTVVCDLHDLPRNYVKEPPKDDFNYYFRPWKTMLVRTIAGGGESLYLKGKHAETIPAIWQALNAYE